MQKEIHIVGRGMQKQVKKYNNEGVSPLFIGLKFSYVSRTKNAKVKFVEYLTKFVNNLLTVQRL